MHYQVEHILGHRGGLDGPKSEFLVRWTGFDPEDMQFVKKAEVRASAPAKLNKYIKQQKAFAAAKRGKATLDSVEHVVLEDDDQ